MVQPLVVQKKTKQIIAGHQRLKALKELGIAKTTVVFIEVDDTRAKLLNLALNRISGSWDEEKLAEILADLDKVPDIDLSLTGFLDKEIDNLVESMEVNIPENFDLAKEVKKASVKVKTRPGDLYELGPHRLLCGDSTKKEDMQKLMGEEKADFCFTDPPYILEYLRGKYKGTLGFGYKTNRRYLTTESAPEFDDWLSKIHLVAKRQFNIIVFENWKNTVKLWQAMEKYWKVKNMLIWHLTNRCQGFAGKSFFSKYDIALFASSQAKVELNMAKEEEPIENEYLVALYAIGGGKPYFDTQSMKGKYFASDHIDFKASDATSSGQSIIFGTKPIEILIPYIKILTRKGDIIAEPFGRVRLYLDCRS